MKTVYKCEVCERTKNSSEEALQCENSHTIIKPKLFWLLPFVGVFMTFYSVFRYKNGIVIFENNWKGELYRIGMTMSSVALLCLWIFFILRP